MPTNRSSKKLTPDDRVSMPAVNLIEFAVKTKLDSIDWTLDKIKQKLNSIELPRKAAMLIEMALVDIQLEKIGVQNVTETQMEESLYDSIHK